jgi:LacI family transcriptional regulator
MLGWHDPRLLLALVARAREAGWHLETRHFFTETVPEGWRGDGMIVSNPQRRDVLAFIRRQTPRQPTVLVGGNNPGLRAPQVVEDNSAAGRMAAEHLIERGHKSFAWLNSFGGDIPENRWAGFHNTLSKAGCDVVRLEYRTSKAEGDWNRRRIWLVRRLAGLPHPIGLFTLDDQLASEAIEMCAESGIRVPEDVSVVGVGNIDLACETSLVPISSVDLAPEAVAEQATRLLDRLMRGGEPPKQAVIVPPRGLVVRRSSAMLAATHPTIIRAVEHIRRNLSNPLDMKTIALAAGISRRSLYTLFEAELGRTPAVYLRDERMARAKKLLGETDLPITEIATVCGFGTMRTLDRIFLADEGRSPFVWRKAKLKHEQQS